MTKLSRIRLAPILACAGSGLLLVAGVAEAQLAAEQWLQKMARAVETANYRGTVLRVHGGQVETLRIVHKYEDGQVTEKLETVDGAGRTIIRDASGVRCILPESKAVLVEQSSADVSLFNRVPVSMSRLNGHYDVLLIHENQRVADRGTVLIAVRPHDEYRYGHRLWLDHQSALPLKTQLLDVSGRTIEEVRFADISIEDTIPSSEFKLKINTDGFTFFGPNKPGPAETATEPAGSESWVARRLPPGFRLTASLAGEGRVQHLMFDDGMASVSVFIEPPDYQAEKLSGPASLGGANAFSVWTNNRQVTAVGEVPLRTVRDIASAIGPAVEGGD